MSCQLICESLMQSGVSSVSNNNNDTRSRISYDRATPAVAAIHREPRKRGGKPLRQQRGRQRRQCPALRSACVCLPTIPLSFRVLLACRLIFDLRAFCKPHAHAYPSKPALLFGTISRRLHASGDVKCERCKTPHLRPRGG